MATTILRKCIDLFLGRVDCIIDPTVNLLHLITRSIQSLSLIVELARLGFCPCRNVIDEFDSSFQLSGDRANNWQTRDALQEDLCGRRGYQFDPVGQSLKLGRSALEFTFCITCPFGDIPFHIAIIIPSSEFSLNLIDLGCADLFLLILT
jgi:hypothetical protein